MAILALLAAPDVRIIDTSAGQAPVRETAGRPKLLCVHSLLVDPDLYGAAVPLVAARGYRCVVPELPLCGHVLSLRAGRGPDAARAGASAHRRP